MASSLYRKTRRNHLRRMTQWAPGLLLSFTLFTCLLRCAECATASNMILIVTDDLDVELGGMVSWVFRMDLAVFKGQFQ